MVLGLATAVTRVPFVSQCADTHKIALGLGNCFPIAAQLLLNSLFSMAFIGLPCPINSAGRVSPCSGNSANPFNNSCVPLIAKAVSPMFLTNSRLSIEINNV
ncbi:MAG: hypothetical protein BWY67_00404 [Bacteroidetes bacterium ADurb.Bin397]|nr:MAG: hypothetical protein BWY67_00404 [Bacteroidetes bacterium ADurb.Bin397]